MDDIRLLTKVATLYYRGTLNQQEIAQRLGVSRQTISRYLRRSQDLGIVNIKINSTLDYSTDLEYQLEKAFNLSEVMVITPPIDTEESVKEALGIAGADFLQRRVQTHDIIGVAWSSTVLQCALHLPRLDSRQVTVVQLNGSENLNTYSTSAERIVEQIAWAFNGTTDNMVVPMLVDNARIKKSLLSDSRIAAAFELASRSQLALFGVGIVSDQSSLYKAGYLDDALLEKLRSVGAVGEILGRFYNQHGEICFEELNERTIAVDLENLKTKRISAAIAAGPQKIEAILGMLRGSYCNVLITSDEVAKLLLSRVDPITRQRIGQNLKEFHSTTLI